jgi:hypothetical protein
MTFEELPADWPTMPLIDSTHMADVLDLFVSIQARREGALMMLICDEERRPLTPVQFDELPPTPPPDAEAKFAELARQIGNEFSGVTVLFALARSGRLRLTAVDKAWLSCINSAFAPHVEIIGLFVITLGGSIRVEALESAA